MPYTQHRRVSAGGRTLLAALVTTGAAALLAASPASAQGTWALGPSMNADRAAFAAAPTGGRLLVTGGHPVTGPGAVASAEVLTPALRWIATGSMATPRTRHEAAPLPGGRVLVAGGATSNGPAPALASSEVWDPASNTFATVGAMSVPRQAFALTPLASGEVLATGGSRATNSGAGQASAELFDPATGLWSAVGPMIRPRLGHTATGLPSGHVLVVGDNPVAGLYNPATKTFTAAGTEPAQRSYHTATLLQDGRVLVAGGVSLANVPVNTAAVWDPATGAFTPTGPMSSAHAQASATLLPDGRVVVAGGFAAPGSVTSAVDVYDPLTNLWTAGAPMAYTSIDTEATTLPDGRGLFIGGALSGVFFGDRTSLYTAGTRFLPPAPAPVPAPVPPPARFVPPAAPVVAAAAPVAGKFPAKLRVERANVKDGELDVYATVTNRANGDEVEIEYEANGETDRFTEKISDGRLRFTHKLEGKQRDVRTGILTYTYKGNDRVRATEVRLRAANGKAKLERGELSLRGDTLSAEGTISDRATGVVRLIFSWNDAAGRAHEQQLRAEIENGKWSTSEKVPPGARAGGYLSIQFTGDLERNMRGEQTAKQVLPGA